MNQQTRLLRDDLRLVYQVTAASRNDFRTRVWETIKVSALIGTGTLAGSGGIAASQSLTNNSSLYLILDSLLIIVGSYLAYWTYSNVRREQGLLFQDEFTIYQIEKILGLHKSLPENYRWKPDAPNIFSRKHLDFAYNYDPLAGDGADPVEDWSRGKLAEQIFLKQIALGFSGILLIPMWGVGLIFIFIAL